MNKSLLLALAVVSLVAVLAVVFHATRRGRTHAEVPRRRQPTLTAYEQPMYFRLREAFPEYIVLAQVAFSALLDAKSRATRNRFDRKVADFVLCTRSFEVVAVIELDDSTHAKRDLADASRDRLLTDAGYRVLRFKRTPDVSAVREAVDGTTAYPTS